MNVLIDARPLCIPAPGGVTRLTKQLLDELFVIDSTNTYILGTTGWQKPVLPWIEDQRYRHLHRTAPNKVVSGLATLKLISFEHWMHPIRADLLFLPNLGFVRTPRIPYVLLVHDLTFLTEPRWYSFRARLWHKAVHAIDLIKNATHLVTISRYVKTELVQQLDIDANRISVLPYLSNPTGSVGELPSSFQGKRYLLCLGANDRRKNAMAAVHAWKQLRQEQRFEEIEFVLIGNALQTPLPTTPGLQYFHRPTDDLLATLYQHAAVFMYPTWSEGYGIPLHEAARFGTPCVASTGSALEETAPQGTLLIPPEKPHLLLEALRIQLTAPQRTSLKNSSTSNESGQALLRIFEGIKKT